MAVNNLIICGFFVILMSSFLINQSRGLRIDISPDVIIERVETVSNVACLPDSGHHKASQIVILEIFKDGDQPMAIMRANSKAVYGNDTKSRLQVEGIFHKKISKSFLNLTLLHPKVSDSGVYTCVMYYLDEMGMMKEAKASQTLVVEDFDIDMLIKQLRDDAAFLRQQVKDQDQKYAKRMTDLENEIKDSEKKCAKQVADLENKAKDTDQRIANRFTDLENKTTDRDSTIEQRLVSLEDVTTSQSVQITGLKDEDSRVTTTLSALEEIAKNHTADINSLTYEASYKASFSATGKSNVIYAAVNRIVRFPDVIYQNGTDFNPTTGIFTASRSGIYSFNLFARVGNSNNYHIYIDLKKNDEVQAILFVRTYSDLGQSSISVLLPLAVGDEVKPVVRSMNANYLLAFPYSMFSGYFVSGL